MTDVRFDVSLLTEFMNLMNFRSIFVTQTTDLNRPTPCWAPDSERLRYQVIGTCQNFLKTHRFTGGRGKEMCDASASRR